MRTSDGYTWRRRRNFAPGNSRGAAKGGPVVHAVRRVDGRTCNGRLADAGYLAASTAVATHKLARQLRRHRRAVCASGTGMSGPGGDAASSGGAQRAQAGAPWWPVLPVAIQTQASASRTTPYRAEEAQSGRSRSWATGLPRWWSIRGTGRRARTPLRRRPSSGRSDWEIHWSHRAAPSLQRHWRSARSAGRAW